MGKSSTTRAVVVHFNMISCQIVKCVPFKACSLCELRGRVLTCSAVCPGKEDWQAVAPPLLHHHHHQQQQDGALAERGATTAASLSSKQGHGLLKQLQGRERLEGNRVISEDLRKKGDEAVERDASAWLKSQAWITLNIHNLVQSKGNHKYCQELQFRRKVWNVVRGLFIIKLRTDAVSPPVDARCTWVLWLWLSSGGGTSVLCLWKKKKQTIDWARADGCFWPSYTWIVSWHICTIHVSQQPVSFILIM